VARLLARRSVTAAPKYPDLSTREKAWKIAKTFADGDTVKLLP